MVQFAEDPLVVLAKLRDATHAHARHIDGLQRHTAYLSGIEAVLKSTSMGRSGGFGSSEGQPERRNGPMVRLPNQSGFVPLDQVAGRAVPFDLFCTIPVINGQMGALTQSMYVLPAGPFVAVERMCIFQSAHTVSVTNEEGAKSEFYSRSYGRFRPVSSSSDVMDAQRAFEQPNMFQPAYLGAVWNGTEVVPVGNPIGVNPSSSAASLQRMVPNWPGNGLPIIASALSMSAFRTMSFDGLVEVDTKGSQIQRQSQPIPTTFWTHRDGGGVKLATLDVFEPSETITFNLTPQHVNNPPAGNVQNLHYFNTSAGYDTFDPATGVASGNPAPAGLFPALAGQYDGHEGTMAFSMPGNSATSPDPASRDATGLLHIGFRGYYIFQAPSVVR